MVRHGGLAHWPEGVSGPNTSLERMQWYIRQICTMGKVITMINPQLCLVVVVAMIGNCRTPRSDETTYILIKMQYYVLYYLYYCYTA